MSSTPLSEILSRPSETSSESTTTSAADLAPSGQSAAAAVVSTEGDVGSKQRDDRGRFAGKVEPKGETLPATTTTIPAAATGDIAAPPAAAQKAAPEPGSVPIGAFIDMRLEAREAKRRADQAERELAELKRPKEQPVDFFQDPDAAFKHNLAPLEQRQQDRDRAYTIRMSRLEAREDHGRESVSKMEQALSDAIDNGDPEMPSLRAQMLQSDNPFAIAMGWFKHRSMVKEVGDDPTKYRSRIEAEAIAKLQAEGWAPPAGWTPPAGQSSAQPAAPAPVARQAAPAPVMPSNFAKARNVGNRGAGPAWSGPTTIKDIFARG